MLLVLAGGIVALLNHQEEMARIRLERERQEFFQRREDSYNEGLQILTEMDFQYPDKEKAMQASLDFVNFARDIADYEEHQDWSYQVKREHPHGRVLYNTAAALGELAKVQGYYPKFDRFQCLERGLMSDSYLLRSYVESIPADYNGPLAEKILAFRQEVMDYYTSVVLPKKNKPVVVKPVPYKEPEGPGYYDKDGYWQTKNYDEDDYIDDYEEDDYIDDYDHDGYLDEVYEDNAGDGYHHKERSSGIPRHSGGGTRRWRD